MNKRISLYLSGMYPGHYRQPNRLSIIFKIRKYDGTNFEDDFVSLLKNATDQDYFFSLLDTFQLQHPKEYKNLLIELEIPEEVMLSPQKKTDHNVLNDENKNIECYKPILFTEGKSDVGVLKIAWLKLNGFEFDKDNYKEIFDDKCTYRIKSADLFDGQQTTQYSTAETLGNILYYWKGDCGIIGIFDRDDAGYKGLHILNTATKVFKEDESEDGDLLKTKSKDGKLYVAGIPYPIPPHREGYEILDQKKDTGSIELEYYFTDDDICKHLGSKTSIEKFEISGFQGVKVNIKSKSNLIANLLKKKEHINFTNFEGLFDYIEEIFSRM